MNGPPQQEHRVLGLSSKEVIGLLLEIDVDRRHVLITRVTDIISKVFDVVLFLQH